MFVLIIWDRFYCLWPAVHVVCPSPLTVCLTWSQPAEQREDCLRGKNPKTAEREEEEDDDDEMEEGGVAGGGGEEKEENHSCSCSD